MLLPYYEDREQTAVKHEILVRYLAALVPIVGNWASDIAYIDCLAGPWGAVDPDFKDTSFARAIEILRSTRRVLSNRGKSPTMRCLFIERDPAAFRKLKLYCDGIADIDVRAENWDLTEHIQDVVQFARERTNSFSFYFIDPNGWEQLQIKLITPLLKLIPNEVLINLMTSWITRFLSDESKQFDRLLGPGWQNLLELRGEEQEEQLVRIYAGAVQTAGEFDYVCTLPVLKPNQDAFHYYMIYATRHIRGVEVFKETEKHVIPFMHETRAQAQQRKRLEQSGQLSLLSPEAHYKETRFTRHRLRSLEVATNELRRKLESADQIAYQDARATVLQNSAVTDADFRKWLGDWKAAGLLEITNQRPWQKGAHKGDGQHLKWMRKS
jgi:three-Cys-motif partner protein